MLTTEQVLHLERSILNIVESIDITLQAEPKYGGIYLDLNDENLEEVKEDLMSIHRNIEKLRRKVSSHAQKQRQS